MLELFRTRIARRGLVISALLGLLLLPVGASNAFAAPVGPTSAIVASIPPSPDVQKVREALFIAHPELAKFSLEIDGLTPNLAVANAFVAWYAAQPAEVLAVLTYLQANPAVASEVYAWLAANPAYAGALFWALAGQVDRT
jgi:hypothetical protein